MAGGQAEITKYTASQSDDSEGDNTHFWPFRFSVFKSVMTLSLLR